MPKRRAVIVGVNGHEGWDFMPLKYAVQDASRMHALLQRIDETSPFDDIELLLDPSDHAVRQAVIRAVKGNKPGRALGPGDLFVFYFSGHGKRERGGKYLMLCPQAERTVLESQDTNGTVTDAFLKNIVAEGSFDCLLVYDACRSVLEVPAQGMKDGAPAKRLMDGERNLKDTVAARKTKGKGVCATVYSCRDGEQACELEKLKGGLFTCSFEAVVRRRLSAGDRVHIDNDLVLKEVFAQMKSYGGAEAHAPGFHCEGGDGIVLAEGAQSDSRFKPAAPVSGRVVVLEPPRLHITTRPSGARVWVDGKFQGAAPAAVALDAGQHAVRVEQEGYAAWGRRIQFDGQGDASLEVALVALPQEPEPGEVRVFEGGEFAWIPPGTFEMGSKLSPERVIATYGGKAEWKRFHEREHPRHTVTLTRGFWLATKEVTVGEFRAFADAAGYQTDAEKGGSGWTYGLEKGELQDTKGASWRNPGWALEDRQPVVLVSWKDAVAYCEWLSRKTGETYRLPTEAQWEYACRAGTDTEFWWGDRMEDGRGCLNGADETQLPNGRQWTPRFPFADGYWNVSPVGSFKANHWGLYDMHGNVWEWCSDWYGDYPSGSVTDPSGPPSGKYRVVRGGSWGDLPGLCRSAARYGVAPGLRSADSGLRLLRTP
ncbi:MAG: SUMF1/EgtB/PvdO family nonheme iron enzyme [Candidatus Hydrogenedentes bacterium]|nr:SUMF1/EgtB/PvdO family nonheme iron enzyme [Candidatus Hydrogenedentota bacterium]